jgi:hypothetical protein
VEEVREEELVGSYLAAVEDGDSSAIMELRSPLVALLARDTLESLQTAVGEADNRWQAAEARAEELEDELEAGRGLVAGFTRLLEDLGLGLGWTGLYFTGFIVLWRGRTPGKRLFGLRVVRLDNLPIGWWSAFGRFGGYAAGVATGLLGFLQIFWDPNRQAIQDKIAGTVVLRE